jgi:UDP-N-acetyl-2-amino-2-deoxyglucuronate dehydrogenase
MEKPIALNYQKAEDLVSSFENSEGQLFPVLQVRFNPAVQAVKQVLAENKLGKILNSSVIIRWTRPQQYFDDNEWRGTLEMDGGSLLSQAIHYIDIMQYVVGPVKKVYGKTDTVAHNIPSEDLALSLLEFESGAKGILEFTINTYPHNLECSLSILGTKGTIKIGGQAMNEIETWKVENTPEPNISEGLRPNVYAEGMYTGSCPNHHLIYQNMVNVLVNGENSFIKASDALNSIKIIDAIKKSSQANQAVSLS